MDVAIYFAFEWLVKDATNDKSTLIHGLLPSGNKFFPESRLTQIDVAVLRRQATTG